MRVRRQTNRTAMVIASPRGLRVRCLLHGAHWNQQVRSWVCGFPSSSVVKNPPASAGDRVSTPDMGRSHMPRTTKPVHHSYWAYMPQLLKPVPCTRRSHRNEKPHTTPREQPPLAATRKKKKAHAAAKTQNSQKINFLNYFLKKRSWLWWS